MAGKASVNFTIAATDAASGQINKVNKSLGGLSKAGQGAKIALGAAAAATAALAAISIAAVTAAAKDERDTIRLNAALKARGLLTADLTKGITDQIKSMATLGFTDDQVRAGIEVGSRFFKDRATILKANATAANIAAVTGMTLEEAMMTLGKATKGQTRGLKALGIEVKKGATAQDILTAANAKYAGTASEIANSTSGKFATAQIQLNEAFEKLGYKLLPIANKALDFFSNTIMPAVESALNAVAPIIETISNFFENTLAPAIGDVATSVGESLTPALKGLEKVGKPLIAYLQHTAENAVKVIGPFVDIAKTLAQNLSPIIGTLAAFFVDRLLPAMQQIQDAVVKNLLPPLTRLGKFIAEQIAPRIAQLVAFLADKLGPVITTVANVISTSILPVLGALAGFVVDVVLPAILALVDFLSGPLGVAIGIVAGIFDVFAKAIGFVFDLFGQFIKMVTDSPLFKIAEAIGGIIGNLFGGGDKKGGAAASTSYVGSPTFGTTSGAAPGTSAAPNVSVAVTLDGKKVADSVDTRIGRSAAVYAGGR
jgi:hypothetical protein